MAYKRFYTRDEWHARTWRDFLIQGTSSTHECFIHHTADHDAEAWDHLAEQKAAMRGIQNFHMDERGWDDIAYHFVVFQPFGNIPIARVYQGRPTNHIPAAQLNHNTNTIAICVAGDFEHDDKVSPSTRFAICETIRRVKASGVRLNVVGGHEDVVQTSCPGNALYREIPRIAKFTGLKTYA